MNLRPTTKITFHSNIVKTNEPSSTQNENQPDGHPSASSLVEKKKAIVSISLPSFLGDKQSDQVKPPPDAEMKDEQAASKSMQFPIKIPILQQEQKIQPIQQIFQGGEMLPPQPLIYGQQPLPMVEQHQTLPMAASAKTRESRINILELYKVFDRTLLLQLDPNNNRFKGQIIFSLQTVSDLTDKIAYLKLSGISKLYLELTVIAKQINVFSVHTVEQDPETEKFKKVKQLKISDDSIGIPAKQALQQEKHFLPLSRHLYQIEDVQRNLNEILVEKGTIKLRKKVMSIKLKNFDPKSAEILHIMVEFECDQITDIGGIREVQYRRELSDVVFEKSDADSDQKKANSYLITNDYDNQSFCWMPQLVGSLRTPTPWKLRFLVPKEYMVIASGKQTLRQIDNQGNALHEYVVAPDECLIPDKVGFVCSLFPLISPFEVQKKKDLGFACFLSKQKKDMFNERLISESIDFICDHMQEKYNFKETKVVFLPNLFPNKFPKQSMNFGGGLHILDQELIFRPNQIDKRHHLYKHLTSSLAFAFFGARICEKIPSDLWLLTAVRERFGDKFYQKRCGSLIYQYHYMKRVDKFYKLVKQGVDIQPLQKKGGRVSPYLNGLGYADPIDQHSNDMFYLKCNLLMHMIESKTGENRMDQIISKMYQEALSQNDGLLSSEIFRKTFRKECGMSTREMFSNWINATGCPKLTLSYGFNKRNNSLELTLTQEQAAQKKFLIQKNIEQKINKIFGLSESEIAKELLEADPDGQDIFSVDANQACKRWFTGEVKIRIYQVEGSGGDICDQLYNMTLRDNKSKVKSSIILKGQVKRTMQSRKKDQDLQFLEDTQHQFLTSGHHTGQGHKYMKGHESLAQIQAAQILNDIKKFEMNEYELEDYPQETKNIFHGRELDNNPVLWIRVDPQFEYIRKINVIQEKKNNWLYQLLREDDIIGQIEAARQLANYNEELVYEILKTVSKKENFFFKVRKEVLKAMKKMEISAFNQYLSHESYLIKCFNQKNFDEVTGFYKENNFNNLLQYYHERDLLQAISMCKEQKLKLNAVAQNTLNSLQQKNQKQLQISKNEESHQKSTPSKRAPEAQGDQPEFNEMSRDATIQFKFEDGKLSGINNQKFQHEMNNYRISSSKVAEMLLKVLAQNDNSENYLDDSFLIKDILASLGRIDNLNYLQQIAGEIYRQFKLDQISNNSPHFAITIGAIKGYFNMQKQIYRFQKFKKPNIDYNDQFAKNKASGTNQSSKNSLIHNNLDKSDKDEKDQIAETEKILQQMKQDIDNLLLDPLTALQLRLFIFDEQIKNILFFKDLPFVKAISVIIDAISRLYLKGEYRFAVLCLRDFVLMLESAKFIGKLNFIELYLDNEMTKSLIEQLWKLVCQPSNYLTPELLYWVKRIFNRFYGKRLPPFLVNMHDMTLRPFEFDLKWSKTEAQFAQEEQVRLQEQEKIKMMKKKQIYEIEQQNVYGTSSSQLPSAQLGQVQNLQGQTHQGQINFSAPTAGNPIIKAMIGTSSSSQQQSQGMTKGDGKTSGQTLVKIKPNFATKMSDNENKKESTPTSSGAGEVKAKSQFKILTSLTDQNQMPQSSLGESIRFQIGAQSLTVQNNLRRHMSIGYDEADEEMPQDESENAEQMPRNIVKFNAQEVYNTSSRDQSETFGNMGDDKDDQDAFMSQLSDQQVEKGEDTNNAQIQYNQPKEQEEPESSLQGMEESEQEQDQEMYDEDQINYKSTVNQGDESEYDPFAEEVYIGDMQKCWLILGKLYYHFEATDFLEPVTADTIGDEMYEDYCRVISQPMDISTVMHKVRTNAYNGDKEEFRQDIELMFANCREFNEADTEIYVCSENLSRYFRRLWYEYGLYG